MKFLVLWAKWKEWVLSKPLVGWNFQFWAAEAAGGLEMIKISFSEPFFKFYFSENHLFIHYTLQLSYFWPQKWIPWENLSWNRV